MDKRPIGYVPGKGTILDKKPPKNPKFANIGPTIDTGYHANHIEVVSDKYIAKRKNEIFKRIKPSTVANLLKKETNPESIYNLGESVNNLSENIENINLVNANKISYGKFSTPNKQNPLQDLSDNQSVCSYITTNSHKSAKSDAISTVTYATEQLGIGEGSEFLLLDLREPEEYEQFHIKEAINFPAPNIARDKFSTQLYSFKNKDGKLIIVYHFDERTGIPHATSLHQKGFENVYLISGGIEAFLQDFPELVEGKKVPVLPKQDKTKKVVYKRSNYLEGGPEGDIKLPSNHVDDNISQAQTTVRSSSTPFRKSPSANFSTSKASNMSKITSSSKKK